MGVLRDNHDSLMAVLEAFVYDPLINWRLFTPPDPGTLPSPPPLYFVSSTSPLLFFLPYSCSPLTVIILATDTKPKAKLENGKLSLTKYKKNHITNIYSIILYIYRLLLLI